jgi:hypothetical protein
MIDSVKHSSLMRYRINYEREKFYSIGIQNKIPVSRRVRS